MSEMTTEVELKYCIHGRVEFDKVVAALPAAEASFIQTNNYLDDAERSLRKAKIMLRAREVGPPMGTAPANTAPTLTFEAKCRVSKEDGLFVSEERAQALAFDAWRAIRDDGLPIPTDGSLFQWLAGVAPFGPLAIIGKTVNHRRRIRSGSFVLELDSTEFSDGSVELEIECETTAPDDARAHIEGLLAGLGVRYGHQTEGKYARFLRKAGL